MKIVKPSEFNKHEYIYDQKGENLLLLKELFHIDFIKLKKMKKY